MTCRAGEYEFRADARPRSRHHSLNRSRTRRRLLPLLLLRLSCTILPTTYEPLLLRVTGFNSLKQYYIIVCFNFSFYSSGFKFSFILFFLSLRGEGGEGDRRQPLPLKPPITLNRQYRTVSYLVYTWELRTLVWLRGKICLLAQMLEKCS